MNMKRVLFVLACLPLLALAACSSDDEPAAPEASEKVYSLNKSEMADMVEDRVWIIDYESEKCFDGSEEIDGEYVSYGSGSRRAFKISGDKISFYYNMLPDNWEGYCTLSLFREEDGFVYISPSSEYLQPEMRIESVVGDKLTISCYHGHITQYFPDGTHSVNRDAYATYECRLATPQEKEFYETIQLLQVLPEE